MKKKAKKIIIISAIVLAALTTGIIGFRIISKIIQASAPRRQTAVSVGAMVLKKEPLEKTLTFKGIVEGDPQVKVYSPVAGKFQSNAVVEGAYVNTDEVIAYINRDVVGQTYQPALVRAPVSGMVKKLYFVDRGAPVSIDKPVAEIANPAAIKIVLNVGEEDLSRVTTGMEAVITSLYDDKLSLPARVFSVTPFVDSDTFSGSIIIKADNRDNRAKIGMSAVINVIVEQSDAYLIPADALLVDLESAFVFVNIDNTARRVAVKPGYTKGKLVEISGELSDGDMVITDGSFKLIDGAKLNIVGAQQGQ